MKVTYKDIPVKMRCAFQFNPNYCYPDCKCTGNTGRHPCWEEVTKEVNEQELKEMIDNCKWIVKVYDR